MKKDRCSMAERKPLLVEYRNILRITQETPTSLRNRVCTCKNIYSEYQRAKRGTLRRQLATGRLDRQEVSQSRPELPGSDSGRQRRPDASGRQVRIPPRLQVLHLCHLVDSPGDHARRRRPKPHDSHPGPHGRNHEPRPQRFAGTCCRSWVANQRSKKPPAARMHGRRSPPRARHEPLPDQPRSPGRQQRR